MPGEREFLEWIRGQRRQTDLVAVPLGDDLAVLRWRGEDLLLVGVDQVLDGVHFDSTIHPPRAIGRKVMNRNLSDCAAMGCLPAAVVTTAALPVGCGLDYAKDLYLGLRDAAEKFDCAIVGGDTGSWHGKLVLTVTILGRSDGVQPVTRSGAKPGDEIYVTGPLGGSILGRHMTFEPRVTLGRRLAESGRVTAMIDISDGLSRDLSHICRQSSVGAIVESDAVPVHADAVKLSQTDGRSLLDHALNDGEDHELLVTGHLEGLGVPVTRVGKIVAEPGMFLRNNNGQLLPLEPHGWNHLL
jgi:thiamine-monophosphate kinase